MKERDRLQLINTPLITEITRMDRAAHWQLILDNLETLVANQHRQTACIYGYPYGMEHFEKIFHRFYDEDPDATISGLINDLSFTGPEIPATFWSRQGYLDNISSTRSRPPATSCPSGTTTPKPGSISANSTSSPPPTSTSCPRRFKPTATTSPPTNTPPNSSP